MTDVLASLFLLSAVWFVAKKLWKNAIKAEEDASEEARAAARGVLEFRLGDVAHAYFRKVSATFSYLFDKLFTSRCWSGEFFVRTVIASSVFILLIGAVCAVIIPEEFALALRRLSSCDAYFPHGFNYSIAFFVNYFSFIETRRLIRFMSDCPSLLVWPVVVVADVLLTMSVIGVGAVVKREFWLFVTANWELPCGLQLGTRQRFSPIDWFQTKWSIMTLQEQPDPAFLLEAPQLWSTFLTSIWLWLYLSAIMLLGVIQLFDFGRRFAGWAISPDKPFKAVSLYMIWIMYSSALLLIAVRWAVGFW